MDWMCNLVQLLEPGAKAETTRTKITDYLKNCRKNPKPQSWDMRNEKYDLPEEDVQKYMQLKKVRFGTCRRSIWF